MLVNPARHYGLGGSIYEEAPVPRGIGAFFCVLGGWEKRRVKVRGTRPSRSPYCRRGACSAAGCFGAWGVLGLRRERGCAVGVRGRPVASSGGAGGATARGVVAEDACSADGRPAPGSGWARRFVASGPGVVRPFGLGPESGCGRRGGLALLPLPLCRSPVWRGAGHSDWGALAGAGGGALTAPGGPLRVPACFSEGWGTWPLAPAARLGVGV